MSEITQACSPALECTAEARPRNQGLSANELSPIRFGQSRRLWQFELAIYLSLLLCASLALFPFMLSAWYWPVVWLAFGLVIGRQTRRCWRRQFSFRTLYCSNNRWYLRDIGGEREINICAEILLWPHIIVLSVSSTDKHKTHLIFTRDAMTADDWRRLRVWLRFLSDKG